MGLIKEPIEIDFTLMSRTWTAEEEKEFSELIRKQKHELQLQITSVNNVDRRFYGNSSLMLNEHEFSTRN